MTWLRARLHYLAGFFDEREPQSAHYVCAVVMIVCGCITGLGTLGFARVHPHEWQTTAALASTTLAFLGPGGTAALWTATKSILAAGTAASLTAPTTSVTSGEPPTTITTTHPTPTPAEGASE